MMIKLHNLEKYFNRNKANEIHVINDISLTLPEKGLVVLLGPSGSGKTTLLNVLGGLDKVQSGTIQFDNEEIKRYSSRTWDRIRNKHVGYVFQNYNLLTNLTVYDNIALTLNMVNIYDKEEIDKRIDYILDAMGMINYRKRRASQLSGGQQQRVAIARALAKNPKVIIADEPTGNLDSKNTQEIMNIIKKISLNKLVVLVTHEENIANFYGDRIIRLTDGKITSDDQNGSNGSLDVRHDTDIYLGDLHEVDHVQTARNNISVYSDEEVVDELNLRLIVKNKTIYIDLSSKEYQKVQLLEKDSEVSIYEGKYEQLQRADFKETDFNLESVIQEQESYKERHSVITIKDSLRLAFSRLKGASKLGKAFYVGFAAVGLLIAISIGLLSGIFNFNPEKFLTGAEETVIFDKDLLTYEDIVTLSEHESVNYFIVTDRINLGVELPLVFQNSGSNPSLNQIAIDSDFMDQSKIVMGREVQAVNEIVIDNNVADNLIANTNYNILGITTYQDLMKLDYTLTIPGRSGDYEMTVKLVGIVEDNSTVVYAQKELIYMSSFNVGLLSVFEDDITIDLGTTVSDEFDMLIYHTDFIQEPVALNTTSLFNQTFRATGAFTAEENVPLILVNEADILKAYFTQNYVERNAEIKFHANDQTALIDYLQSEGITAESSFDTQYAFYREQRLENSIAAIIFASVVLGASAISYYFILRSSLLSRIYEVSVYRALGVTKGDIRKMFVTEIVLITTITSMIGYLATSYVMYRVQLLAEDFWDGIYISFFSIVVGIIIIYLVNIIAGLIPVSNLLRKTPAEILSKYDF
jgi:ABC-type lipoprotein export system ATPase subunit/ABC-type antimicrobial peptide transport system permease subunit